MMAPKDGGVAVTLASQQAGASEIAVDSANAYWTNDNNGTAPSGAVMRMLR
jgi:hypothetical protein